ncbi:hypothetical protein K443DRAFT_197822 [Laccaria amethystina LaAM-08-1]|jgi:hypothetical protein|uniref:Uncharacterized protein n=1 Tax=Laccaria amethystina LaAM-08-1 TaxID=1095629 RepID=A0A0C9XMF2_9AGAR|nr:hypothetical protein K443DRAFT_197822 [Laccaria amethystina LaAM-08-1]
MRSFLTQVQARAYSFLIETHPVTNHEMRVAVTSVRSWIGWPSNSCSLFNGRRLIVGFGHVSNRNSRPPMLYDAPGVGGGMRMDLAIHESILESGRPVILGSEDGRARGKHSKTSPRWRCSNQGASNPS